MHEKFSKNIMVDNAVISNRVVVFYFMYIVHEGRAMISNQGHHRGAPVFRHSSLRNKSVGSQEESRHRPTAVQYGFLILAWKVFKLLEGPALFFEEVGIFHNKNKEPNQLIIQYNIYIHHAAAEEGSESSWFFSCLHCLELHCVSRQQEQVFSLKLRSQRDIIEQSSQTTWEELSCCRKVNK